MKFHRPQNIFWSLTTTTTETCSSSLSSMTQASGGYFFKMSLFSPTVLTQARITTSDGVHANAFSLAARVKISASKKGV